MLIYFIEYKDFMARLFHISSVSQGINVLWHHIRAAARFSNPGGLAVMRWA